MITQIIQKGSIALTDDGREFAFTEGPDHTQNKVDKRLRFYLGEWFGDLRIGVPYHQQILGKKTPEPVIRSTFTGVIQNTPGVARITRLDIELDAQTRKLSVNWAAVMRDGSHISSNPFMVI